LPRVLTVGQCGDDAGWILLVGYDHEQPATGSETLPVEAPALRQRIGLDVVGRLDRGEDLGVPANKLGVVAEDLRAPDVIWEFDAPPLGVPDGLTFGVGSVFHDIEAAGSTRTPETVSRTQQF
jgi:hypothetical protein